MTGAVHRGRMRKALAGMVFLFVAVLGRSEPGFWQQMTPEERRAAGVEQLTPEQQAALNAQANRYAGRGLRQAVELAREQAKAEAVADERKQRVADAGLAARGDDETIRTRIAGDFRGWSGATTFTLENGQVWQQTDKENRFFPKQTSPAVDLIPSKLTGWKLQLVTEGLWIRVKRIR